MDMGWRNEWIQSIKYKTGQDARENYSRPTIHVQLSLGITISAMPASEIAGREVAPMRENKA